MITSDKGRAFIKEVEGFSAVPYLDTAGKWTIGWGHCTGSIQPDPTVSIHQLEDWLDEDIKGAEAIVSEYVVVPLNQDEFDALVSFAFNVGGANFSTAGAIQNLNAGNEKEFCLRLMQWINVTINGKKVPDKGLVNRRTKELLFYLGVE